MMGYCTGGPREPLQLPKKTAPEDRDWVQQGLLLPRTLREMLRQDAGAKTLGIKRIGTAAIALYLGAPEHVQAAMLRWIDITANDHPDDITPEHAWEVFRAAIASDAARSVESEGPSRWFVDRLLDPEISLPPGEKPSDRAKEAERRKAE